MIVIPENLPHSLAPMAWMLGSWRGWGTANRPERSLVVDGDVQIIGSLMRMRWRFFEVGDAAALDPETPALDGAAALTPRCLAWEETQYWRLAEDSPMATTRQSTSLPSALVRITVADSRGFSPLWAGQIHGPRAQLRIDTLAREAKAPTVEAGESLYGLVNSDLFFTTSLVVSGEASITSARVARVGDPILICPAEDTRSHRPDTHSGGDAARPHHDDTERENR